MVLPRKVFRPSFSWSDLPQQALITITEFFTDPQNDVVRLRSVCSNWRQNVPPPPSNLPMLLYFYNLDPVKSHVLCTYKLFKTTVFLLEDSEIGANAKWLVTVSEPNFESKMQLLNPFTSRPIGDGDFPHYAFPDKTLKFLDRRVTQVSKHYSFRFMEEIDEDGEDRGNLNMELDLKLVDETQLGSDVCFKAMVMEDDFKDIRSFLIINDQARVRSVTVGNDYWEKVGECSKVDYCDMAVYDDCFYCVDRYGTVIDCGKYGDDDDVVVIPSPEPFFGEWYLVKAGEDLYLVGRDFRVCGKKVDYDDTSHCFTARPGCGPLPILFHVYVLDCEDPRTPEWVEVNDLADYIFVVSRNGSFAIEAEDCPPMCGGNYIIYVDEIVYQYHDGDFDDVDNLPEEFEYAIQDLNNVKVGCYDFVDGTSSPLSCCREQLKMFWPPPDGLALAMSCGSCSSPSSSSYASDQSIYS
ncbi:hypothetical protein LWI28_027688 [Acer negundo]|uniref:KIB1-4 beta-propeller domain-containing protein n=1 Tax=Acer negundo TaxID=4023 RepID=A0AAD5NYI0_ACENE|nr:hypothetical protein LWI28_027688 [Acer negundo]